MTDRASRAILAALLLLTFAARAWRLDQPLVENYVGRQIPTAMVARNLERGSGFARPQLDTGPFPNFFLVEPPLFEASAVFVSRLLDLKLSAAGRLVSIASAALAGWGLFGLARRRQGNAVALISVALFSLAPIVFRYGRAFQPDMLMLGLQLASLRLFDQATPPSPARTAIAWIALSTSLALKITSAYIMVPLLSMTPGSKKAARACAFGLALLPALFWYAHAAILIQGGFGSRATADNLAVWLHSLLDPRDLLRSGFWIRYPSYRSFTPIGFGLACAGWFFWRRTGDRFWRVWGWSAIAALVILGRKAHHEYYWLTIAPIVSAGAGEGLARLWNLGGRGPAMSVVLGLGLASASIWASLPTFRTPAEWSGLEAAGVAIDRWVPKAERLIAPEALLYESDRRGARLEFDPASCRRSAGEWGERLDEADAIALAEVFRRQGIRYAADVGPAPSGSTRRLFREALRSRATRVLIDRPHLFLARLPAQKASGIVKEHRR